MFDKNLSNADDKMPEKEKKEKQVLTKEECWGCASICFIILAFCVGGLIGGFLALAIFCIIFGVLQSRKAKKQKLKRYIDLNIELVQENKPVVEEKPKTRPKNPPRPVVEPVKEDDIRIDFAVMASVRSYDRSLNEMPKRVKGMLIPVSMGGYISPSGGFVNYIRYSIKGKCAKTGKNKKYYYEAMSDAEAQAKAKEDGLSEPFIVQIEKMPPPSDSQLSYARSLDAVIPEGACKRDVTAILNRITDEDESPDAGLARFAHAYGVCFSRFIGKNELLRTMVCQMKGAKLATLYAYAVYLQETGGSFGDPRDTPIYDKLVECAKMVENDPALLKSLEGRSLYDYENPNRGTKVYKSVIAFLMPML